MRCAVAAGVTSSAKTSSAPVIWLVSATERPSTSRKPRPTSRTGTPPARAMSGSTEAKSNGRAASATTRSATAATTRRTSTCELVMPANVWRRSTMNHPITPAITATIVPAASACCMNGNVKSVRTSVTGLHESPVKTELVSMVPVQVGCADHHEASVGRSEDFDRDAVQRAERLRRDDLLRRTFDRRAAGEVDDAVEVADDRVHVMRDEQDCNVLLGADVTHERGDAD